MGTVIALVDGEHHPSAVRDSLAHLDRERGVAAVLFCGGEEKVPREVLDDPLAHYGFPLVRGDDGPAADLERLAAETGAGCVVDLSDEPILPPDRRGASWRRSPCGSALPTAPARRALRSAARTDPPIAVSDPPRRDRYRQAHGEDRRVGASAPLVASDASAATAPATRP